MAIDIAPAPTATTGTTSANATPGIVHYEIGAKDANALITFYSGVFGWKFEGAPGMEDYKMAQAGAGTGIAIYTSEGDTRPTNYMGVDSVEAFAEKITSAGGTVIHRFTVPHMGYGAVALDPEQNPIGLWQQDASARPE